MILAMWEAIFNGLALGFMLLGGYWAKKGDRRSHQRMMLAAIASSVLFLGCYVAYHLTHDPLPYVGGVPYVYYPVLISHIILAAITPFLVLWVVYLAVKNQIERHRVWVRWVWPIWVYVSVTGIAVYFMVQFPIFLESL